MIIYKHILKIFLSPFIIALTVFEFIASFVIRGASLVLNIISIVVFITAVFLFFNDGWKSGLTAMIFAWLISPLGIPLVAQFIVDKTVTVKNCIKQLYT